MTRSSARLSALAVALVGAVACSPDALPPAAPTTALAESRDGDRDRTPNTISLEKIGGFDGGAVAAAEITAFDHVSDRLFVVNGALGTVDVLDLSVPSTPVRVGSLAFGGSANSVAAHRGLIAIAVEGAEKTLPGSVEFYDAVTLEPLASVTVGALPDMVTFSSSGRYVLVANEGEPNADYSVDPDGTVSIVDVRALRRDDDGGDDARDEDARDEDAQDDRGRAFRDRSRLHRGMPTVRTVSFASFNGRAAELRANGVRIYGPNASVAQDFEPEYIAIDEDERTAWVTLQENNAVAIIDIRSASVRKIVPLGYKDHRLAGNGLDASDRDNAVNIRNWPVFGMYQPDAIASFRIGRQTYLITANEGDAREYVGFTEEARVASLALDPTIFADAACGGPCKDNARLGRLTVTTELGRNPTTGLYDALYVLGGRSFSILNSDAVRLWDSGEELEQRTASLPNVNFNASNTGNARDDRSDNKGPEPEGVTTGRIGNKTFAFIGLERVGGVMVYDVSVPTCPVFVNYVNTRDGAAGDRGPEGIIFVPANRSPNRKPLVIIGNEVSGTTAIFQVVLQ